MNIVYAWTARQLSVGFYFGKHRPTCEDQLFNCSHQDEPDLHIRGIQCSRSLMYYPKDKTLHGAGLNAAAQDEEHFTADEGSGPHANARLFIGSYILIG
jgi:hypothetical protein